MLFIKNIFTTQKLKEQYISYAIQPINTRAINDFFSIGTSTMLYQNKSSFTGSDSRDMTERMTKLTPFADALRALTIPSAKHETTRELMGRTVQHATALQQYFIPSHSNVALNNHLNAYQAILDGANYFSYDIEGLGGIDSFGANRFDGMTELAYTAGNIHNQQVETAIGNTKHYFFGIDKATYDQLKTEVQQQGFATSTNRGQVLANRLAIYGHPDTKIKGNQIINEADIGPGVPTVKEMLKGLEVLRAAGALDESTRSADGLTDGDRFIQEFVANVNRSNVVLTGHNITNYDNVKLALKNIDISKAQKLDTLTVLKEASKYLTSEEIYKVAEDVQKGMIGKTSYTQENIIERILGSQKRGLQAHTASVDSALHSLIIGHPIMRSAIGRLQQPDAAPVNMGELIAGRSLVLNKQSSYNDFHSLSFLSLPNGEINTGNGYSFFPQKGVTNNGFKPGIMKKDTLYTFGGVGTLTLSKEDKEALKLINGDYAQNELYYALYKPYGLEDTIQGDSTVVQLFKSQDHLQQYVNSQIHIGDFDPSQNKIVLPVHEQARKRAEQNLKLFNLNTQTDEALSLDDFITQKTFQAKTDRAGRRVRNFSYNDTKNLLEFMNNVKAYADAHSITERITGVSISDMQLSATLANNQKVDIGKGLEIITKKIGHNAKYNTIDNLITMAPFAYKNQEVLRKVSNVIENTYKDETQKAEAYKVIMSHIFDNANLAPTDLKLSAEDLSYIEVPLHKLTTNPKAGKIIATREHLKPDYMRIDLNRNNAGPYLINQLLHNKYDGQEKRFTGQNLELQGKVVLDDLAQALRIKDFDVTNFEKANDAADALLIRLRQSKQKDPYYEIHKKTIGQALEKGITSISEAYGSNAASLEKTIQEAMQYVPVIKSLDKTDPRYLAEKVVKTFNQDITPTYFYDFGFSKKHADYMHHIYNQFQKEQIDFYSEVFKNFKGYDGLGLILDNNQFAFTYNGKAYDMREYLPSLKLHDDMAYIKVGNMEVALHGVMQYDAKSGKFMLNTNFARSVQQAPIGYRSAKRNIEEGISDPAKAMQHMFKEVNSFIRESPDVKLKNRMNQLRQFDIDMNDVRKYIPLLVQNGNIQVTKGERAVLSKFADPGQTGKMGMLGEESNATLKLITDKYLDQALAIIFNTDAYEGELIKDIAKNTSPFLAEKRASEGYRSYAPNPDAFGEFGPGNRITRWQNNFMSYDTKKAQADLEALTVGTPKYNLDQGATSHFGYQKGISRLVDFESLDKELSDQIVVKKLNISYANFRDLIEKHFGQKSDTYTQTQWDKIHDKMRQYNLSEDESVIDTRILENVFWQQNEIQKVRELRKEENDFVRDKNFIAMHKALDYKLTESDGKVIFKYGDSIERNRHDPLFKMHGFHRSQSLTLASYDGYLKKGIFSGQENIMLTEDDINELIKGMSLGEAKTYIDSLDSYYYLERKHNEPYVKLIAGNTEKTKSRSLSFAVGELDEELKTLLPSSLIGSNATFPELRARAKALGVDESLIERMEKEHYAVDLVRNAALGDSGYGFITNANRLKHKGIDTHLRELFPSLRQYHMDKGMSAKDAALQVRKDFSGLGFSFDVSEDGSMLFEDDPNDRRFDFAGLKAVIRDKYKFLHPDLLEEAIADQDGLVGTTGMVNLARTKEHEISIVSRPVSRTDQHYALTQKINHNNRQIKAREALLTELTSKDAVMINSKEDWYEDYVKLKSNIEERRKKTELAIQNIQDNLNLDTQTQAHLDQLNSCIKDLESVNKAIQNHEKMAQQYTEIVNNPNISSTERKKHITLANQNRKELETLKATKQEIIADKQKAMQVYVSALNQNTKNKRQAQRAIGAAQYRFNRYEENLPDRLASQIEGLKRASKTFEKQRQDFDTAYKLKNKGIVVDELAFMKLRNKRVSLKTYQNLAKLTPDSALQTLGIDSETIASRPIFSTIVNDLVEMGLTNSTHEVLTPESAESVVTKLYGDSSIATGILGVFRNSGRNKLSVEAAEARYTLSRMDMALGFNEGQKEIDFLKKAGFREIDIRHYQRSMDYDASFLEQGDSIFGSNLILNVNGQKLAVPYMPHSVYGESVVQKQYEKAIIGLQNAVQTLDQLSPDDSLKDYDTAKANVSNAIEKVKESVHLITAKGSPVAETITKSRQDTGFLAKSASFTSAKDADLTQAFYKGKSISDWFDEGVYINAGFTSKEMFKEMGFFSEEFKDAFKDGDVLFNEYRVNGRITDEQLESIYKKYGISGLSGRFPYIQEMSINAKQLYLSDNIKGNTIKNFLGEQGGKSSDNDGDYEAFMALKAKSKTGDFRDLFVDQALGNQNATLNEFGTAMGIDAIGATRFRAEKMEEALNKERQSQKVLDQAKVYDRLFFDGKLFGEQVENPYFDKDFSIDRMRTKLFELETLYGKSLDLDAPDKMASFINDLDDSYDKEGYKKAVVQSLAISGRELAGTAKTMKKAIGEVNLMMRDFDQAAEILADNNFITGRAQKAIAEMSYAIQQESISPKNAQAGDINIESIYDFKRILNAAKYGKTVEYNGEQLSPREAMGGYLDNTIKERYLEKYGATESIDFWSELEVAKKAIYDSDIDSNVKDKLWKAEQENIMNSFYEESRNAVLDMLDFVGAPEVQDVSAYNKLFTREEATAKFYNTDAARRGLTALPSQKNAIMHLQDDLGMTFSDNQVESMISPSNALFKHTLADPDIVKKVVKQSQARQISTDALLEGMGKEFKSNKTMAGIAVAGIGSYLLMGAIGSSVTANTTNQAEQMETGDTLSDYGTDYSVAQSQTYTQKTGYVINVNAQTDAKNAQRVAGQVGQSINQSLNANLNMTLNINETPLKQMQIDQLIQNSLFNR